jgi:hypothetical protein
MKLCIVGTGRCGTKLLGTTFHKHPEFAVFNETHWIPKMYELFGEQRVAWRSLLAVAEKTTWVGGECLLEVNSQQAGIENYEEFLDELKSRLSRLSRLDIRQFSDVLAQTLYGEGVCWGDKTPDYGYYMGLLHQLWPDCKFIHLIRRPVATAHSMSLHPGFRLMVSSGHDNWCPLSFDRLYQNLTLAEPNIGQFIRYWSRRVTRIRDEATRIPSGQYLEVSFEDLVSNPNQVLAGLADYAGVDPLQSWLEGFSSNVDQSRVVSHFSHLA